MVSKLIKLLAFAIESWSWLKIVASPTLIGCLLGAVLYFSAPGIPGQVGGFACVVVGIVSGVVWANRIWKREGTTTFLSKTEASPDLDSIRKNQH